MLETWLQQYGYLAYLAILVGTFLEGETILILAGFAAHRGYLDLPLVILAAFLGTLFGDQLFFFIGRSQSTFLLKHKPNWQSRLERVQHLITNYRVAIIIGFRFLYGFRTITPFALGMNRVPLRLFIPLNILSALLWAAIIGTAGYLFGKVLEVILGNLKQYELIVLSLLAGIGVLVWLIHLRRQRKIPPDDHNP